MDEKSLKIDRQVLSEENLLQWDKVQENLKGTLGSQIYTSWLKNIKLLKEYNHYVILLAPTRFVRDWIVSRYADKILDLIKLYKKSIQRIEFLIEEVVNITFLYFKISYALAPSWSIIFKFGIFLADLIIFAFDSLSDINKEFFKFQIKKRKGKFLLNQDYEKFRNLSLSYGKEYEFKFNKVTIAKNIVDLYNGYKAWKINLN